MNIKQLAERAAEAVKHHFGEQLRVISEKIAAIEARAPERGEKGDPGDRGEKGDPGDRGEKGDPGERGVPGLAGEKGDPGERGERGMPGDRGEKGDPGERGERGLAGEPGVKGDPGEKGMPGDRGEKGDSGERGEKGDPGERGEPGERGLAGDRGEKGEKGDPGERGEKGDKGDPGERGEKGDKGDPGERGEKGIPGDRGDRGEKGEVGDPGLDALMIDVQPGIDEARSYPPRTYASHRGGLWVSRKRTRGMDGWECIVEGVAAVEVKQDGDREVVVTVHRSSGESSFTKLTFPVVIDRGVFKEGTEYTPGDGVSWGGSFWIAQRATKEKPHDRTHLNADWRLAVKRGRDGRDGERGSKGDKGDPGRPGRDLTQLSFDGGKH